MRTATEPNVHVRAPRQARSRNTLQRIRDAAVELMVRKGVEGVTVRDVVELAGTSVGSFYQRFSGRAQLIRYLRAHARASGLEEWKAELGRDDLRNQPLEDRVQAAIAAFLVVAGEDERRLLLQEDGDSPIRREMRRDVAELLLSGPGAIRHPAPQEAVVLGWEMTMAAAGLLLSRNPAGDPPNEAGDPPNEDGAVMPPLDPDRLHSELTRLLMGYLGGGVAPPPPTPATDLVDPFDVWA